jgi:hypothetical protein
MTTSQPTLIPRPAEGTPETEAADRMAHTAVGVSAVRCLLMYIVLPAAGPIASQYSGIILPVSMLLHGVTIVTSTLAVSRAMRSRHPWRVAYAALGVSFFLFSLIMMIFEGAALFS